MWLLVTLACAPVYRFPGPLTDLGSVDEAEDAAPSGRPRARGRGDRAAPDGVPDAVARARALVGARPGATSFRWDCSGYVGAALSDPAWSGSTADLYAHAESTGRLHHRPRPRPGDLAFFDDTYDRDGDGRVDDPLSHVALVESVGADATVVLLHLGNDGITRFRLNLTHPHDPAGPDGAVWNDPLRAPGGRDRAGTRYLAAELWRAFATPGAPPVSASGETSSAPRRLPRSPGPTAG